jgi:predicted TIM-barrel fold metal-dependent hydrolase
MKINSHVIYFNDKKSLLKQMDKAGFDKAVIAASPKDAVYGKQGLGADNGDVLKALGKHRDRLIGCAYLNPLEEDCISQIDKWADEGFKAVKIYPADGYYPDDKNLYPFYSKLEETGLALIAHMGITDFVYSDAATSRRAANAAFAYPMKFDPICRLFPKLNIVILNMGYPLMVEAWSVHHNSRNIYLHLGGEGTPFRAPATGFSSMGGNGFIPLDEKRIVFGSGAAEDMGKTHTIFNEALMRMGFGKDAQKDALSKNPKAVFGLEK